MAVRNEKLQALCRDYLRRLRYLAQKHDMGGFIDETIKANARHECEGTQHEVEMLARAVNDERLSRQEVPDFLGKSYRQCVDDGDFNRIKKLTHTGIYSKVSTLLNKKD